MSYYNLTGGLHSAEIRLLQRALKDHLQTATNYKAQMNAAIKRGEDVKAFEVKQANDAIDAMVRLSNRLRKELEPVTEPRTEFSRKGEWPFPMINKNPAPITEDSPTGRRIVSEPNMQNIPIRTPEGTQLRKAFINQANRSNKK